MGGQDPGSGRDRGDQRLDSDDVHDPCQIIGQNRKGHLGGYFGGVLVRKCVAPMRAFIVPKGYSTVTRRWRMACGFASRRCCTAFSGCSCSHRVIRRSGPVVHCDWTFGAPRRSWHACSNSPPSAHGGGLMRTQSWRSSKTPAWKQRLLPCLFRKRNLAARMAPREHWRIGEMTSLS